jgi:ABC-2 type transport system ATP-binding protein
VVLDDRVADDVALTGRLLCRIRVKRADAALAKALATWNFRDTAAGLHWEGEVAGPDRLRFLGMISRYVAITTHLSLTETEAHVPSPS